MNNRATPKFWHSYHRLPSEIQRLADNCYQLLRVDPRHPSLHFKKIGRLWSVRIGMHYRALHGNIVPPDLLSSQQILWLERAA